MRLHAWLLSWCQTDSLSGPELSDLQDDELMTTVGSGVLTVKTYKAALVLNVISAVILTQNDSNKTKPIFSKLSPKVARCTGVGGDISGRGRYLGTRPRDCG